MHAATVPGLAAGARYGLSADGPYAPERGLWFDPAKLLVDPYAVALDRPFRWHRSLAAPRADAPRHRALRAQGASSPRSRRPARRSRPASAQAG